MIGRQVPWEELQEVLGREKDRKEIRRQFEAELKGIRKGECLLYEAEEGLGVLANLSLSFLVSNIAGVKMITDGDRTYIYREK